LLVGIDIVDIARVKKAIVRTPRFLERLYTRQELDYCLQKANPYPSLAARLQPGGLLQAGRNLTRAEIS
jgi:holo-[acyl-carrier protein] synthase